MSPPAVPVVVRNKALAAGATRWLDDLPELVACLEREWSIAVGRPYADATEAFVAAATLGDGTPGVVDRAGRMLSPGSARLPCAEGFRRAAGG